MPRLLRPRLLISSADAPIRRAQNTQAQLLSALNKCKDDEYAQEAVRVFNKLEAPL